MLLYVTYSRIHIFEIYVYVSYYIFLLIGMLYNCPCYNIDSLSLLWKNKNNKILSCIILKQCDYRSLIIKGVK